MFLTQIFAIDIGEITGNAQKFKKEINLILYPFYTLSKRRTTQGKKSNDN